ncbi:MAG: hypothetical protein NHG00_00455 [Candidatus Shikimatogenerans sp. JK-2022]|nr:hypothetical protein [Candidatus Shikimatogenerans bostrichidophilus]
MIKIGINGFNIISKMIIYNILKKYKIYNIKIVAININNDNINIDNLIYMLKYDNIYKLSKIIIIKDVINNKIIINNKLSIKILNVKNINWKLYNIKYLIDTIYTNNPYIHIKNGAEKTILTYYNDKYPTYVLGVNHNKISKKNNIISYASNTTNCITPILKILHREYIIKEGFITIIKSNYDNNNNNFKLNKDKYYKEIYRVLPDINKLIKDITIYLPININISLIDLTIKFKKKTTYEKIKKKIKFYSKNEFTGIVKYSNKEILYTDILYNKNISIFDAQSGSMLNKKYFKIISWYNNVIGYTNKIIDLIIYMENNN